MKFIKLFNSKKYSAPKINIIKKCAQTVLCASTDCLCDLDKEEFDFDWEN